jgi:hypothetical protein
MVFCTNCGAPVDSEFCGNCGTKIGSAAAVPPEASRPPSYPGSSSPSAPGPVNIAPKKKKGPWFWVLLGCGGLIVIAGIVILAGGFFVMRTMKQAGIDPELMQKNPAMAVAKMMAAVNPDIEVLSVDDAAGVIRVRDKKTGKALTVNLADAMKGKIVFEDDTSGKVEIQAQGEGDKASLNIKSGEGSLSLGANTEKLPDWLPSYPGAEGTGAVAIRGKEGQSASYTFKTGDAVEDVATFYEDALKNEGMEVEKKAAQMTGVGAGAILAAKDSGGQRSASISIGRQGNTTVVSVTFESKK